MNALTPYLHDAFGWCLRTSAEVAVLVVAVVAVQSLLGKRLSPRWQYWLWLILVARMLLPWMPESRASLFNVVPSPEPAALLSPVYVMPMDEPSEAPAVEAPRWTLRDAAAAVWVLGALALLGQVALVNLRFRRRVRRSGQTVIDASMLGLLETCKREMGVGVPVALVSTRAVESPALLGFVRPRLLIPEGLAGRLSTEELRFVFLHEMAHLKRRDILVGWLLSVLQAVHWFNPLVWYAFHRMRQDRELACDALALSRLAPDETDAYGRTVLRLFEEVFRARRVPGLAGILEDTSQLKRRVRMIAVFRRRSLLWSAPAVALLAVAAATMLTRPQAAQGADASEPKANEASVAWRIDIPAEALEQAISVEYENVHVSRVAADLEQQTGIRFEVDPEAVMPEGGPASGVDASAYASDGVVNYLRLEDVPLTSALKAMLRPMNLAYTIMPDHIVITRPEKAQTFAIVVNETGVAVADVSTEPKTEMAAIGPLNFPAELLEAPVTLQVEDTHLDDVAKVLTDMTGVDVHVDHKQVLPKEGPAAGRDAADYASDGIVRYVKLENVPLTSALKEILGPMDLAYVVMPDYIVFTGSKEARQVGTQQEADTGNASADRAPSPEPGVQPYALPAKPQATRTPVADIAGESRKRRGFGGDPEAPSPQVEPERLSAMGSTNDGEAGPAAPDAAPLTAPVPIEATNAIAVALKRPVSVEWENRHLTWIAARLEEMTGVRFEVDSRAVMPEEGPAVGVNPAAYATDGIVRYIRLEDVPLSETLKAMLRPLGLTYAVTEDSIVFTRPDGARQTVSVRESTRVDPVAWRKNMEKGLKRRISVEWGEVTVKEAVGLIVAAAKVNVITDSRAVDPGRKVKAARYRNRPLSEVLTRLTSELGLAYGVEPGFMWISTKERLETESFEQLETRYYELGTEDPKRAAEIAKTVEKSAGKVIDPGTGKTLSYVECLAESGVLVVHNTPTNLEKAEKTIALMAARH